VNELRTLPIRIQPLPGEALDSWLEALAFRMQMPVGDLLHSVGLNHRNRPKEPGEPSADWMIQLKHEQAATIATLTGTTEEQVMSMTLATYDGKGLLIDRETGQVNRRRLWGRPAGSRYCPACLAETGGRWSLSWRLGWSFACLRHQCLLADACPGCGRMQRIRRRSADALAALAAKAIRADLYITHREYLHRVTWPLAQGVTFCSTDEALAVIGLYLRSQGSFLIAKDPESKSTYNFNKGLWYWVGTRELLPEGWRWYKACVDHSQQGPNDLIYLGGAVFQRVSRVLRARDDLLRAVSQAQDNDIADDTLTALDTCLVYLMGAVDATARVAHAVLGLTSNSFNAGWQRRDWLRSVQSLAPGLAAVVGTGATGKDTLTILRLMRNSVHAEGTHPLAVGQPGRRRETLVGLSGADASEILDAADRLGGRAAWGFREMIPGRLHADPRLLLEKLVPAVVELLNMIMAATPVEALSGVSLKSEDLVPPTGAGQTFGERERNSIRWQLGL
jgi:hypothetical protein